MNLLASLLFVLLAGGPAVGAPMQVMDDLGTTVMIEGVPRRVACLSPGATEIIYALGAGDRLVTVCGLCDFPPEAKKLPKAGDFLTVSIESVLGAHPDLVVATGGVQKEAVLRLRSAKIPVLVLYPHSISGIAQNMAVLGRVLGREKAGNAMAARFNDRVRKAERRVAEKNRGKRLRVYFEVSPDPVIAASELGYVGDLIARAGGDNIVPGGGEEYPRVSPEYVIAKDPEVIILSHCNNPAGALEELKARPGWAGVSAVRNGRVIADLDMDLVMRPGPRLAAGVAMVAKRLYRVR